MTEDVRVPRNLELSDACALLRSIVEVNWRVRVYVWGARRPGRPLGDLDVALAAERVCCVFFSFLCVPEG